MSDVLEASAARARLEGAVRPPVDALAQLLLKARLSGEAGIGSMLGGVMNHLGESEPEYLARRAARDPVWDARLRALAAQRAGAPDPLSALLARLRGPQMPPAVLLGSMGAAVNGQPVMNPAPSVTPPPMIGMRW